MFQEIRNTCLTLFEDGKNSYKYIKHYREELNKYICSKEICDLSEADILEQLLFILMIIYIEKTKTRYHSNDIIALEYEKIIIVNALTILRQVNYKQQKVAEINKLLTDKTYEDYLSLHEKIFGYKTSIGLELITDFTEDNVSHIYTNMNMIKKLFELNASVDENRFSQNYVSTYDVKMINQLYDYCFCLYFFAQKV
jgi:hypothetical protein